MTILREMIDRIKTVEDRLRFIKGDAEKALVELAQLHNDLDRMATEQEIRAAVKRDDQ